MDLEAYQTEGFHDELFDEACHPRAGAELLVHRLAGFSNGELAERQRAAEKALLTMGITFNVYGHEAGTEKIWPFDIVPRVIEAAEWALIERGLAQRIRALNLFIDDIYNKRQIVTDKVVPDWLVDSGACFRGPCAGLAPPRGIWCHITGTDLVRGGDGVMYVLEDNLRTPSGVSYVLENREVMKRTFPQLFEGQRISPVEDYPEKLLAMLQYVAPKQARDPTVVVLTP